ALSQFSRQRFEFIFVHNLPVSGVGVNISKTGRYTIQITVSFDACAALLPGRQPYLCFHLPYNIYDSYSSENELHLHFQEWQFIFDKFIVHYVKFIMPVL
ncbi:hypothetical protein, partial [Escherichia coli]|uniref:hypothetical protein n=1 Tax=Escherichia coli TaxID=562 RepID=UPI00197B9A1F